MNDTTDESSEESFRDEMLEYIKAQGIDRLLNFAPLDSESETGFAAQAVDLGDLLNDAFSDTVPQEQIDTLVEELQGDGTLWGDTTPFYS